MIEAVTSVLASSQALRGNAEQVSSARSQPAPAENVSRAPQAPYVSPYISVDVNFDRAVLQIRDADTGDVVRQFPSESALEAARRAARADQAGGVFEAAETPDPSDTGAPSETGVSAPDPAPSQVAQAQQASAALAAGARAGIGTLSAGVSVIA